VADAAPVARGVAAEVAQVHRAGEGDGSRSHYGITDRVIALLSSITTLEVSKLLEDVLNIGKFKF
jgi:hypothetical protein